MQSKTILATLVVAAALLLSHLCYANIDISEPSGFYDQAFQLTINATESSTIFYTTDGSDPSTSFTRILHNPSDNILINQTTVIRVWAIAGTTLAKKSASFIFLDQVLQQNNVDVISELNYPAVWGTGITNLFDPNSTGYNPQYLSVTQNADYEMDTEVLSNPNYSDQLIDGFSQIPTLSIITDKANLFDVNTGIYNHTFEDETVPASVEMINTDGTTAFCIEAGLSIAGEAVSRRYDYYKHSLQLTFEEQYGDGALDYALFGAEAAQSYKALKLRMIEHCSPHDWDRGRRQKTQFHKDQWTRNLYRSMGHLSPHSQFVHVFLNGLYWGMYDLCEIPNADFMASYQNGNAQDYDVMSENGLVAGDTLNYKHLYHVARDVEMDTIYNFPYHNTFIPVQESLNDMYEEIKNALDVNAFIDYFLLNALLVNTDWGANNWYAAKKKEAGGLWQFFPWDAEFALNDSPIYTSRIFHSSDAYHPNELDKLLRGAEQYQRAFGDRVQCNCIEEDGVLHANNLLSTYDELERSINKASLLELARWGDVRENLIDYNTHVLAEKTKYLNEIIPELFDAERGLLYYLRYGENNYYPKFIGAPKLSKLGGDVPVGYQLSLTNPNAVGEIYYTLDGSDPAEPNNSASQLYTEPIAINYNATISARVFVDEYAHGIAYRDTIFNHWSAMCPRKFNTGIVYDNYVSIDEVMAEDGLDNICINMYSGVNPKDFILEFSDPITTLNGMVDLQIYDLTGNALINTRLDLGLQNFYTLSLSSGIYLYTLSVDQAEILNGKIVKN